MSRRVTDDGRSFESASLDLKFAAAVAAYGMLLRGSEHAANLSMADVLSIARASRGADLDGYRSKFVELVEATGRMQSVVVAAGAPD